MIQVILEALMTGLIAGLTGIIWMIVSDIVRSDLSLNDTRQEGTHRP